MSLIIPPGFGSAALVMSGTEGTEPYITTMGFDISGAGGDFVDAANAILAAWGTEVMPLVVNSLSLERVTLSVGQDGPGGSVDSTDVAYQGGRTGNFPPTAMAAILRKGTNELGRRGRGRMYLPGMVSENEVSEDGSVAPSVAGNIAQAVGAALFGLTAGTYSPLGYSYDAVLLHGPGLGGVVPTPLTGVSVAPKVGWIRGRIR